MKKRDTFTSRHAAETQVSAVTGVDMDTSSSVACCMDQHLVASHPVQPIKLNQDHNYTPLNDLTFKSMYLEALDKLEVVTKDLHNTKRREHRVRESLEKCLQQLSSLKLECEENKKAVEQVKGKLL